MRILISSIFIILLSGCQKFIKHELIEYEGTPTVTFPKEQEVIGGLLQKLDSDTKYDVVWWMKCDAFGAVIVKVGSTQYPCDYRTPEFSFKDGEYAGVIRTRKGMADLHFIYHDGKVNNLNQ